MKDVIRSLLLWKAGPLIWIGAGVLFIIVLISAISNAIFGEEESFSNISGGVAMCTKGNVDETRIEEVLSNAGVFTGKKEVFMNAAEKYGIDPVLLIAIALHETGYGTSPAVKNKNNPGGIMDPSTGKLKVFDSLEDGIDFMAGNLYRVYISQGLVTIQQIGAKYAPIGANNDPTNLNRNWVPVVTKIANELGGLSMNCEVMGTGEFALPTGSMSITSNFGYRSDPFGGGTEFHKGTDFACSRGDAIYAADGGQIVVSVKSGYGGGYGHHVIISHGDKFTLYGHMEHVDVDVGDTVQKGQKIGTCGTTGSSTGYHLHFEVQLGGIYGERVDPMTYFQPAKKEEDE
jgi:Peptidase family M23/Mannosyl-glycoprotein endo-beta-N-acetylglucosaminidase